MFSLVALLYKLDFITPSFKTIFFFKLVTISLFVKASLFTSLNISSFLDLLTGIVILSSFLKFLSFSKVKLIFWFWLKFLILLLLYNTEIFWISLSFTEKFFKILASESPGFIVYSSFSYFGFKFEKKIIYWFFEVRIS